MTKNVVEQLHVVVKYGDETHAQALLETLARHFETRGDGRVSTTQGTYRLTLEITQTLQPECYEIVQEGEQGCVVRGGCRLGVVYGVGRFLREGQFVEGGFIPGGWQGSDAPQKPLRGMYLATHFHNYYHEAPAEDVVAYLHDLALWGCNVIEVWYDMHHYKGIDDPEARKMIAHLKAILLGARRIGLRVAMIHLGNEAYANSPVELRADYNTGRAIYRCELCPSKPAAVELMLKWFDEMLDAFEEVAPDYVAFGPYDQGGCACDKCKPWGCNGYLRIAEAKARLARQRLPGVKVVLHTWLFDYGREQGEWRGLDEAFKGGVDWCDYVQADSHERYPKYPLEQGVPGGLPLLNFPEISMWMMHPWGGFGANPLPGRFESLWQEVREHVSGGFPYSEGIYEDINKVLCLGWYWNPQATAKEILEKYIAYEYGRAVMQRVLEAIEILEANHNHIWSMNWELKRQSHFPVFYRKDPARAFELLEQADGMMTPRARGGWRWRILYLRGLIDRELQPYDGYWANEACQVAFEELTKIYHAEGAETKCAPPSSRALGKLRSSERDVVFF